ncbi:MAG: glucoamylase family protein [Candidatus Omnitrophica bacterium]|nr:glucoamylase family protein [Candidatus Omnitrophota bacterium]
MKAAAEESVALNQSQLTFLKGIETATFRGFQKLLDPATDLPVDIASVAQGDVSVHPENAYYSKTSPTNISLGFIYLILARDRGYLSEEEAYQSALRMMATLEKLETHKGFLFNWYHLSGEKGEVPAVTLDRFVSSLDNGDLDACLMATAGVFPQTELSSRIDAFLKKKDYHFFFNKNPTHRDNGMINVGYDAAKKAYHSADYSILNIEGRMTVLVAILKDNIPDSAWKKQGRLVRTYTTLQNEAIPVVAAWGGSLYETLFADEILGGYKIAPQAFLKNAQNMVRIHQDKGKRISESGIWGFSNGEVPGQDRYEMAGVSEIAYNRFPGEFVTLYSSFLTLRYSPEAAIENFKQIEDLNPKVFSPQYGFTDSIDPKTGVINRKILSLDKGMELLSIGNFMNSLEGKKEISDYFWDYAESKGWGEKGRALLKGEEENPSFRSLHGSRDSVMENHDLPAIDLMEVRQDMGAFSDARRAKASFQIAESNDGSSTLEIYYNVIQRYTYCGVYIHYDDLDVTKRRLLVFQIKGDEKEGFPKTIKVEMKFRGEYVQFEHIPLKSVWTDAQIVLPADSRKVDEITFVIENSAAGEHKKGEVLIRSLVLR